MTVTRQQVFSILKSLPMIRFALMLGCGLVATGFVVWDQLLVGHGKWHATDAGVAISLARIDALKWWGLSSHAIIAIVMIALAFGQLGKASVGFGGAQVDLDFDNTDNGASS